MTSVLFDAPGPRAAARHRVLGAVTVLAVLALVAFVAYRFAATGQFSREKWQVFTFPLVRRSVVAALGGTLRAFLLGAVLALAVGFLLAIGRLSQLTVVRRACTAVVELFRAVPLLVLMMIVYYGLPPLGVTFITPLIAVVAGLALYNGAVLAEVFRAGVESLPRGQREAAAALGLSHGQALRLILLPQALRAMLPMIVAQLVVVLKDTALGFVVTYDELLRYAKFLGSSFQYAAPIIPATIVIGGVYVALCLMLSGIATLTERRARSSR